MIKRLWILFITGFIGKLVQAGLVTGRTHCGPNDVSPLTRVNTTGRLMDFRASLSSIGRYPKPISAFIVGSGDAHDSEYPAQYDKRRAYISGFDGSAGTAVITMTKAALWTDGRYFLEADETLDCNWSLMKSGIPGTPTVAEWLNSEMQGEGNYVGVDKTLITEDEFQSLKKNLATLPKKAVLTLMDQNPVDMIWREGRPPRPTNPINVLDLKFAGVRWQDKVTTLRSNLTSHGAGAFVVTALDEIAWLFNLRGSDIDYNPFFLAYSIVESSRIRLYILDKERRLAANPVDKESPTKLYQHLGTSMSGQCNGTISDLCVQILDYNQTKVDKDLQELSNKTKVWVTPQTNAGILLSVQSNHTVESSPIAIAKSIKNPIERNGMKNSNNRDSAELVRFLAFMEKEITSGKYWTEVTASENLKQRRLSLQYNRGLSFETIAGFGSNGAIIHYRPSNTTDKVISGKSLFLLDSGGQYLDGTTDVTRTMHYGNPTDYEKECYTRVLMSAINLALTKWPSGLLGREIDVIARHQLWDVGLVYKHGTGHGIGAYLSVHEGPGRISYMSKSKYEQPLKAYQYYSDEPGYYEDGQFGIRLETIVTVVPFTPKYSTAAQDFLQFEPVTFVPFEPNLIDYSILNSKQVSWLNEYNAKIRENILPLLGNDQQAIDWLNVRTKAIPLASRQSSNAANISVVTL
ncbi:Xaa-Pro aminopeptidase 1 [Biomphalaria glabrata]|nr:xaa-Pro aminopeptidase 1 [Biomphalaria glabrata]